MATQKDKAAKGGSTALAALTQTHDELAGVFDGEVDFDGLGGIEPGDVKLRMFLFNLKGKNERGEQLRQDIFLDSVTEEMKTELDCVWLYRHRSNAWTEYDNAEGRNKTLCRSFDRLKGEMEDGTVRACSGCPDAEWQTNEDGKRFRNCSTVHWMLGIELETGMPFVLRFKKTSEPALKQYLQRHHIGRRVISGKPGNYPLFAFRSKVTLEMDDSGNYALPVLQRGDVIADRDMLLQLKDQAVASKQWLEQAYQRFEDEAAGGESEEAGDASFEPDSFTADAGQDFVDAPADAPADASAS